MTSCKKCGVQLPDDAFFCMQCGASVKETKTEVLKVSGENLEKTLKQLFHEGNVRRIIVKDEKGNKLLDIPVTVGVVGAILAPGLAALGLIGALAMNYTIVVERVTT